MKTQATDTLSKFQHDVFNRIVRIRWNQQIIEVPNQMRDGTISLYEYDEAIIDEGMNRSDIIEAIIRSQYTTGGEFATINNKDTKPDAYAAYQTFRQTAKDLADEYIAMRGY